MIRNKKVTHTYVQRRPNALELVNSTKSVSRFVGEVHLLGEILSHLLAEPGELKLREQVFDPSCTHSMVNTTPLDKHSPSETSTISMSISANS